MRLCGYYGPRSLLSKRLMPNLLQVPRIVHAIASVWSSPVSNTMNHQQNRPPGSWPQDQSAHEPQQQSICNRREAYYINLTRNLYARYQEADEAKRQGQQQIESLLADNKQLKQRLDQLNETFHQDSERLNLEVAEARKARQNVLTLYHELRAKFQEKSKSFEKALAGLPESKNTHTVNSQKVCDSAIQEKWKQLDYNIRSLANTLSEYTKLGKLDGHVDERMDEVTPLYEQALEDKDIREFVLQGYFWNVVCEEVFGADSQTWAGVHGSYMKSIRHAMMARAAKSRSPHAIPRVAAWISQGRMIMDELWNNDLDALKRLVAHEAEYLRPFVAAHATGHAATLTRTSVKEALMDIFTAALELDQILMGSKAVFSLRWESISPRGLRRRYDSKTMEAVAWEQDLTASTGVKFFVSPALLKTGNADGGNYDSKMILAKALVVCA